ncbi:MAG: metal ABC transporter permease, partial [Cyanobacteria bacterium J06636_16]
MRAKCLALTDFAPLFPFPLSLGPTTHYPLPTTHYPLPTTYPITLPPSYPLHSTLPIMLLNWLLDPLQYAFMQRSLVVAVMVGIICAVVGSYLMV